MITVRLMEEKDVETVSVLEQEIFSMPWSKQAFYDTLQDSKAMYLVALDANAIVGYCGVYDIAGEGDVMNVAVAKEHRGKGIAYQMLSELFCLGSKKGIKAFTLEVRAGNAPAIHLYEKLGFVTEGIRKNFYEKPIEDALIMWKR
ncbi:MAG: ribosomal protein S18-alanine N-acetyltransferase [Lachnospiraceae bacterium]|nr:ribosomal protein S18-alanine N-acetyltransferase [Lachnospiraceae bacterium]